MHNSQWHTNDEGEICLSLEDMGASLKNWTMCETYRLQLIELMGDPVDDEECK